MNNDQSHQKRTKFRQQIRKKQINQHFQNIRRKHRQRQQQHLHTQSQQILTQQLKQQISNQIKQFIHNTINNYQNKNYKNIANDIQIINQLIIKYSQAVSICLDKQLQIYGNKLIDMNKKDISMKAIQQVMGESKNNNNNNSMGIQEQISDDMYYQIVGKLLDISKRIKYQKFCLQSAILMIKVIWNALQIKPPQSPSPKQQSKQQKQIPSKQQKQFLKNIFISLISLLDSPNHTIIKQHLNKLGLSSKLNQIIKKSTTFDIQTHKYLLKLIYLYNNIDINQLNQLNINNSSQKLNINGITILSTQSTYKQKYIVYSIYFIKKQQYKQLYQLSLLILNQLFQQNPYFIDSIKTNYYQLILQLILDKNRKINISALNLINTITFYSQSASDQLIQQNGVLDYIYGRLLLEKQQYNDQYCKKSIQKCTNIICDLLLTRNQKLKRNMFKHHIWQLCYNSIEQGNKLFHTVIIFKFFFAAFNRKQRAQILPSYLQAVSRISLENDLIPEVVEIKETLVNIFYHSMEHSPQEYHEEVIRLFENFQLKKYMEDFQNKMVQ